MYRIVIIDERGRRSLETLEIKRSEVLAEQAKWQARFPSADVYVVLAQEWQKPKRSPGDCPGCDTCPGCTI